MIAEILALVALALAALPAVMTAANLALFARLPPAGSGNPRRTDVSILIPARDEEGVIASAVDAARATPGDDLEIVVMDDHSEDRTTEIVREIARRDPRVRLERAPDLPEGWCGKQHTCAALAEVAEKDLLVFVDADVRLSPDFVERIVAFVDQTEADLVSGFPAQETGTLAERLLLPLIHFILLGFLPMIGMRWSRNPAFAAGCGQLMVVRRAAYRSAGGHEAIRASRHDGLSLPRAFRRRGLSTLVFDATDVASCRMYRGAREVWNGLAKNATEGLADPRAIVPWTLLLLGGQVLPFALAAWAWTAGNGAALGWAAAGAGLAWGTRAVLARRYRHSWLGVLLHPIGVAALVAVQWFALVRETVGQPVAWKGRTA